jgi:hypothetical protein
VIERARALITRRRAVRDGLLLAGVLFSAFWCWSILQIPFRADAAIYWSTPLDDPYAGARLGATDAYLYSPVFLQLLAPLRLLPWEVFHPLWMLALVACVAWLVGRWTPLVLVLPPVTAELFVGNINLILAVAVVVGARRGAAWAFPLLTKLLPGAGLLWLAARRHWREVAIGMALALALAAVSFAFSPRLWFEWTDVLVRSAEHPATATLPITVIFQVPIWIHVPLGLLLIVVAARRGRAWLLPVGVYLTLPALWVSSLVILLAIPRLFREPWEGRPAKGQPAATAMPERAETAAAPSS